MALVSQDSACHQGLKGDSQDEISVSREVSKAVRREYHRLVPSQLSKAREQIYHCEEPISIRE